MLTNVRDGSDWCQYMDAVLVGCVTGEDFTVTDKTTWNIGNSIRGDGGHIGLLDEMSIWTEVLTQDEIDILYANKSLQDLPTVTTGTESTEFGIEDSSGLHYIEGMEEFTRTTTTSETLDTATLGSAVDGANDAGGAGAAATGYTGILGYGWDFDGNCSSANCGDVVASAQHDGLNHNTGATTMTTWINQDTGGQGNSPNYQAVMMVRDQGGAGECVVQGAMPFSGHYGWFPNSMGDNNMIYWDMCNGSKSAGAEGTDEFNDSNLEIVKSHIFDCWAVLRPY